jgi:hypothetical protein
LTGFQPAIIVSAESTRAGVNISLPGSHSIDRHGAMRNKLTLMMFTV